MDVTSRICDLTVLEEGKTSGSTVILSMNVFVCNIAPFNIRILLATIQKACNKRSASVNQNVFTSSIAQMLMVARWATMAWVVDNYGQH